MSRQNRTKEKTIEEYRKDIFTLKSKLKQDEQYLQELRQKCSEVDVFSEQTYTFQMKVKILQNDLSAVKQKIYKYSKEDFAYFYKLNFCVYALSRSCTIVGLSPEMAYRCVDADGAATVKTENLSLFLRETLRLDAELINPIVQQLDPKDTGLIAEKQYLRMVRVFMIDTEKDETGGNQIAEGIERVCREMATMKVLPHLIYDTKMVNIATTAGALKKKLKNLENVDCVALYCRCDPNKEGAIESAKVVKFLQDKLQNMRHFNSANGIRLKQ